MDKKKIKLKLSGNLKKSISNIERAKTQGKNSVLIEKKSNKFSNKRSFNFNRQDTNFKKNNSTKLKTQIYDKPNVPSKDYEKRKLAEQRATRRLKADPEKKDVKNKTSSKRRELKLTVSRALSGEDEGRARSLASLKRAKQKENRNIQKENLREDLKPVKRDVNIPQVITIRELANRME